MSTIQNQINNIVKLYSQGMIEESLQKATVMLKQHPNITLLDRLAGSCYLNLGRIEDSVEHFKKVVDSEPNNPIAYFELGNSFRLLSHLDEAISSFQRSVSLNPKSVKAHYYLGYTFWQQGRLTAAQSSFERTLELDPNFSEAHSNLGYTFIQLEEFSLAVRHLELATKLKANYFEAFNHLGNAFKELGFIGKAESSYHQAIKINPDFVEAYNNLGNLYIEIGQKDKARMRYQQALKIKPDYVKAHSNLCAIKKYDSEDLQMQDMERIYLNHQTTIDESISMGFCLSKAHSDLGNIERSIGYLEIANKQKKMELKYLLDNDIQLFKNIRRCYEQLSNVSASAKGDVSDLVQPIFIVGMPRSGTTLVEQILASHSLVHGAEELSFLEANLSSKIGSQMDLTNQMPSNQISFNGLEELGRDYLNYLAQLKKKETFVTDKMPLNFRWIGYIFRMFPNAKIIHVKRNPIATCWSNYRLNFSNAGIGFAYDLNDLKEYYKLYRDLMVFWHNKFPNRIHDVCYEKLTENQLQETKALLSYCDLGWEDKCLDFHQSKRPVKTASAIQVREGIYRGSSDQWKAFSKFLGPLIEAFKSEKFRS
ncbi:MAG: tetratricopeptide repeat protein [Enterobacterales bacterium]|nr:tetratricopeptide repeat protein [Enterobacterales bacterium]